MELGEICRKIFDVALRYNDTSKAPVAYVNVQVGDGFPYSDSELWRAFNDVRWDTVLSSAELSITRVSRLVAGDSLPGDDASVRVVSLAGFEEEGGAAPVMTIEDGLIV